MTTQEKETQVIENVVTETPVLPNTVPQVREDFQKLNSTQQEQIKTQLAESPEARERLRTATRVQEPELFGEPKKVEPVVEVKQEIKEPIKQETPVIKSEMERLQETQAMDQAVQVKEQEILGGFQELVMSGAKSGVLADYARKYPRLNTKFNIQLKNVTKQKQELDYQNKYATATPEQIENAVFNSDIVVWDSNWNKLPPETKSAYYAYEKQVRAWESAEQLDKSLQNDADKIVNTDPTKSLGTVYSLDVAKERETLQNSPEITAQRTQVSTQANQVKDLKRQLDSVEDDIRAEYGWKGKSKLYINGKIVEAQRQLSKQYNTALDEYNTSLAVYSDMKADIELQIGDLKYQNEIDAKNYQTQLQAFQYNQSRMDTFAMAEFQAKNKQLAEQQQRDFTREMKAIDQKFQEDNEKPEYRTDANGNILAIINGVATKVRDSTGKLVATTKTQDYTDNTNYNNDLWQFVTTRTYKDGRLPDFFTSDIKGESWTSIAVFDYISKVPNKGKMPNWGIWCGEWVNHYLKAAWISDIRVWDSYKSKKKYINNSAPQVWGLAIWNPSPEWEYGEYGHIWIVTWYNAQRNEIEITDWNKEWNWQKNTYTIPVSQVINSDWGFAHLDIGNEESGDPIINSMLSWMSSLKDLTPTEKADVIPKLQTELENRYTDDEDRNTILRSSLSTKNISDTTLTKLQDMELVKFQLDTIEENLLNQDTGPIIGKISSMNPYDTEAQVALAQLAGLTPKVARGIFGEVWVLTDTDIANYQRALPNLNSTKEKNEFVVNFMRDLLSEWVKQTVVGQARGKRNVVEYLDIYDDVIKQQSENTALRSNKTAFQANSSPATPIWDWRKWVTNTEKNVDYIFEN